MKSTMGDDRPLTVTSILRHGATWHGQREVVTAEDEQTTSRVSYEQIAAGAAQLAHALRALGVDGDDRVGTYLWNNREHLEAYLGHRLSPRLARKAMDMPPSNITGYHGPTRHTSCQSTGRVWASGRLLCTIDPKYSREP